LFPYTMLFRSHRGIHRRWEEQLVQEQCRHRPEDEEVVPLDRRSDEGRENHQASLPGGGGGCGHERFPSVLVLWLERQQISGGGYEPALHRFTGLLPCLGLLKPAPCRRASAS